MTTLGRAKLLILDDWGPETLSPDQARDLLEIIEDRMDVGSIIVTSQIPVDRWHDMIGTPTIAALNRNRWPASSWNAWPASSESAASLQDLQSKREFPHSSGGFCQQHRSY